MLIGIILLFLSGLYQDYLHRQNELWRSENKPFILDRKETHYMPGYQKKIKLTVKGIYLSLSIILISFAWKLIM